MPHLARSWDIDITWTYFVSDDEQRIQHFRIDCGTTGHNALDIQRLELGHVSYYFSSLQGGTVACRSTITLEDLACPQSTF